MINQNLENKDDLEKIIVLAIEYCIALEKIYRGKRSYYKSGRSFKK